jgi:hypothetical protein
MTAGGMMASMFERKRNLTEFVQEGKYAAEVLVEFHYDEETWSPTMSLDDAKKLETVRLALRRGDIAEAAKDGPVFELIPAAAE